MRTRLRLPSSAVICAFTLSVLRSGFPSPRAAAAAAGIIVRVFPTFPWASREWWSSTSTRCCRSRAHWQLTDQRPSRRYKKTLCTVTAPRSRCAALLLYHCAALSWCARQVSRASLLVICEFIIWNIIRHCMHMRLNVLIKELHMPQNIFKHKKSLCMYFSCVKTRDDCAYKPNKNACLHPIRYIWCVKLKNKMSSHMFKPMPGTSGASSADAGVFWCCLRV